MLLNLSETGNEPLYSQIIRQIRSAILRGDLTQDTPLPSLRDISKQHKVSIMTVQKAYDELAREELVIPRRGKGYIVAALHSAERSTLAKAHVKEKFRETVEAAFIDGLSATAILGIVKELVAERSIVGGGESNVSHTKA